MQVEQLSDFAIVRHYQEAVKESGTGLFPMVQLVERLCKKDFAKLLSAGTSHDALVIHG